MSYVIQITHNRGKSYWNGATPQNESDNVNGWGSLSKAVKYKTRESAERDMSHIELPYHSTYNLGYLTESIKVKEITNENQIVESDTVAVRRYKR